MKFFHWILVPAILLLLLVSCSKGHDISTASTYKFVNRTSGQITIDIYGSKADYGANTNRISRDVVQHDTFLSKVLDVGKTYWIDWYSDDYSLNNWRRINSRAEAELPIAISDNTVEYFNAEKDTCRSVMLDGGETVSSWRGEKIGGLLGGNHEFIFRKDFSGEYRYSVNEKESIQSFTYTTSIIDYQGSGFKSFSLQLMDVTNHAIFVANCNLFFRPPTTGRDSLLITSVDKSALQFFVVRQ